MSVQRKTPHPVAQGGTSPVALLLTILPYGPDLALEVSHLRTQLTSKVRKYAAPPR